MRPKPRAATGRAARAYAAAVIALRYPLLLGWICAVAAAVVYLPPLTASNSGAAGLVPANAQAIKAERDATRLFGAPLAAPVALVQRDRNGLPAAVQSRAIRVAVRLDTAHGGSLSGLAGAVPVPDSRAVFPGAGEPGTTLVTFLYFRPGISVGTQTADAQQYATRYLGAPGDHFVGVTGAVPAIYDQGVIISKYLPWVELATLLVIAAITGGYFKSFGVPAATLLCAGVAYLLATRVAALAARGMHATLPPDVQPVLVVLLLGVTTDYTVFFMSGMRSRLRQGLPRLRAARITTAEYAPIIFAAGLLVAAGTASLAVAHLQLISAFGPALALTVLTAMVVSMTLAPALIAIFGRALFRPGLPSADEAARRTASASGRAETASPDLPRRAWRPQERTARFAAARPVALLIAAACTAGLLVVAWHAGHLRLGSPLIRELPTSATAARAATAASDGYAAGILSPTEVIVLGASVHSQPGALAALQRSLARQPDVAGVIGPASLPADARQFNPMLARSGAAARYGIVQRTDPLGPTAVLAVSALQRRLPSLARKAGLTNVRIEVGGDTAAIGEAITATKASLGLIALIMLAVMFLLLAVFLRALLAPVYLLAASILALLATMGLTVWVFQHELSYGGLVYYVPFTVAVLLVSLGSDYNIFVVGRIWEEARRRPLRDAIATAGSQAARAITVAGLALASSFALLALIPLEQFREIAFAMAAGIIIDAVAVRSLLVPALVSLFGRAGMWPGRRPAATAAPVQPEPQAQASPQHR
jgi:RND superfamily putative drug exporter